MLAIKKVSRVSGIEEKGLESGKGREHGGSPLPAVSQHILNTESTGTLGIRSNRDGIPILKIKVAARRVGRFRTPGIFSALALQRTIRRALPLGFRRQALAC